MAFNTRVKRPKDKAAVEGTVGNVTNYIIGKLRNRKFFSFSSLNKAISIELDKFNNNPFQKRQGSRKSVYEEEEKEFMMPLPPEPFELSEWKMATVQMNYHIQVNKMNYSVPYEYVGKRVEVRQTNSIVEIYYKGTRICSHARLHGRANQYSTNNDHMPKTISYLNGIKKDLKNGQKGLEKTLTKSFIDLSVDIRLRSSLIKVVYHY